MLNFFENLVDGAKNLINPEQKRFETIQMAQIELIERSGNADTPYVWIEINSGPFRQLIDDTRFNYVERLGDKNTHIAAIEEIESKLIPLNTVH